MNPLTHLDYKFDTNKLFKEYFNNNNKFVSMQTYQKNTKKNSKTLKY